MSTRIGISLSIIGFTFLASCHPYPEDRPRKKVQTTDAQIAKKKAEEEAAKRKKEAALKETTEEQTRSTTTSDDTSSTAGNTTTNETSAPKPKPEPKKWPFASKIPGKEGFVFSPYNNKVIDVREMPSGQLVADPTYPESEKKYFRVP